MTKGEKMKEYHKIQTVFKRNPETKFTTLLDEFSLPEFSYLQNNVWVFTEKVDGTNIRIMWNGSGIVFGGKTDNAQIPQFLVNKLNERFMTTDVRNKFKEKFGGEGNVCLYGEGYGAKIQKVGEYYRQDQDFVLFDVKIGDFWLQREDVHDIAQFFGLDIVPIIGHGTLGDMIKMTKVGFNSIWGDFKAEGIVARPSIELFTRDGRRIITKIKYKDFIKPPQKPGRR